MKDKLIFQLLNKKELSEKKDISKECYDIAEANRKFDWSVWEPELIFVGDVFIVASDDNGVLGCLSLITDKHYEKYEKGSLTGAAIVVKPELRNQGIGTQLYGYLKENSKTFDKYYYNFRRANKISERFHQKIDSELIRYSQSDDFCVHIFDKKKQRTALIRESFNGIHKTEDKML